MHRGDIYLNGFNLNMPVLRKLCQEEELASISVDDVKNGKRTCKGFVQLLPIDTFHPIQAIEWKNPLTWSQESQLETISSLLNKSYALHFFNSNTKGYKADKNLRKNQLVTQLAYLKCPITYKFAPEHF